LVFSFTSHSFALTKIVNLCGAVLPRFSMGIKAPVR
jgi:hypothetical protein